MNRFFLSLLLANFALAAADSGDTAAAIPPHGLNQALIQADYVNGDFEKVQLEITRFQSQNSSYSRGDSLCIARHLAVIHSANPLTVEVGKHWMYELFKLDTMATLNDMYVSEDIDRLFNKVRVEFMARSKPKAAPPPQPAVAQATQKPGAETKGSSQTATFSTNSTWKKSVYWMLGGAAAAAAATTAIVLLAPTEGKTATPKEIYVPKEKATP